MRWLAILLALAFPACVQQRMGWEGPLGEADLPALPRDPIQPRPGEVLRYGVRAGGFPAGELCTRVTEDEGASPPWDALVKFYEIPAFSAGYSAYEDTTYFNADERHINDTGATALAAAVAAAIEAL